jgi:hypothetical protein
VPQLNLDEESECHDASSVGQAMATNGKRKRNVSDEVEEERACKRQKQEHRHPLIDEALSKRAREAVRDLPLSQLRASTDCTKSNLA